LCRGMRTVMFLRFFLESWTTFHRWVSDERLAELYARARGYLALAVDEDFGMTLVEAISMGTPVVALASGGYRETVIEKAKSKKQNEKRVETGILVKDFTVEGVVEGMKELESTKWEREKMKKFAGKFSRRRFEGGVREVIS